jgi:hypothetical protein
MELGFAVSKQTQFLIGRNGQRCSVNFPSAAKSTESAGNPTSPTPLSALTDDFSLVLPDWPNRSGGPF